MAPCTAVRRILQSCRKIWWCALAVLMWGGLGALPSVQAQTPVLTMLHSFTGTGTDGTSPYAGLVLGSDGNFYGTTFNGGGSANCSGGCGTVFRMTPAGGVTTLHAFTRANGDGAFPFAGLLQGSDGNLYGTTEGGGASGFGTIFVVPDQIWQIAVVGDFNGDGHPENLWQSGRPYDPSRAGGLGRQAR